MRSYIDAKLMASEKKSFKDKTTGETIEYFTNYLRSKDNGVIEANSKEDFSPYEGEEGVAAIESTIKYDGEGSYNASLKVKLKAFYKGEKFDIEGEIA